MGPLFPEIKGSLWQPKQPSLISREEVSRVERMVSGKAIRTQPTTTTFQIFKDGLKSSCNFFSLRLKCTQFLHPILLPVLVGLLYMALVCAWNSAQSS